VELYLADIEIKGEYMFKRVLSVLLSVTMVFVCCACSKQDSTTQDLADMTTTDNGEYISIIWDGRTYVPYTAIAKSDCGNQIGIVGGDSNDKVYEYQEYSTEEWIAEMYVSGEMDSPMLYREIDVTDIPTGLQSEYDWNN
jgi:hypothetical protein